MRVRTAVLTIGIVAIVSVATELRGRSADPVAFTAHEWGTFTSIAGPDGSAVKWRPLGGPADLPSFVAQCGGNLKGAFIGTVRMETPVIYFYANEDLAVSVDVDFRDGVITDWFPPPTSKPAAGGVAPGGQLAFSRISWKNVRVSPGSMPDFPVEPASSHYYAARDTDAAPLLVAGDHERFLFYRGVGQFAVPLNARVQPDGSVVVTSAGAWPIGTVVAFENRGGRMAHKVYRDIGWEQTFAPLALEDESGGPGTELVEVLAASGLYSKEAEAMVRTWQDSWFEEGARLFYIAPVQVVNDTLPLTISPAPSGIERVFVGRVELVTPSTKQDVTDALQTGNAAVLKAYGRFLEPIADRIVAETPGIDRAALAKGLSAATRYIGSGTSSCR
jgi:hypothetical protein